MKNTALEWNETIHFDITPGNDCNIVLLVGSIEAVPELRYLPGSSTAVTRFTLLTSERRKNLMGQMVNEKIKHRIVVLGVEAEDCRDYLNAGDRVKVQGRLKVRFIEQIGEVKHFVTDVISYDVEKL